MLEHAELLRILRYEPSTGSWTRLVEMGGHLPGTEASIIRPCGKGTLYRFVEVRKKRYKASRLAWFYVTARWPTEKIDHRDGNSLNDRFDNYRECTQSQNCWNAKRRVDNSSGQKGVSWDSQRGKWVAYIRTYGKVKNLGRFDSLSSAIAARKAASQKYHGEFARD